MNNPLRLTTIAGFVAPAYRAAPNNALLLCLCKDTIPAAYAAPMSRAPEPPTGFLIDDRFSERYGAALKANPAIHDGAIMAYRRNDGYTVNGWSYRLFPPPIQHSPLENRGTAFHSCLAMSALDGVDGVLLFSGREAFVFCGGAITARMPA
jgi:hypothetical protein